MYAPINVKPAGGGGGGGRAWGGDLTFFKTLQSNSLPTGKSLPPRAAHCCQISKAKPKKGTVTNEKQMKCEDKTVKYTQVSLVLIATISRPYGACMKRRSGKHMFGLSLFRLSWQSNTSKTQISPPLGEQDQSNALPQGQQRQSNPHLIHCLPASITLIDALC